MKLTDDNIPGANLIRSYGPGEVRVGETVLTQSCLISATTLVTDWKPQTIDELTPANLAPILALDPEIVIVGTGMRQRFPATRWMAELLSRGIGCEVMETGAACRTYNVLVSEDRKVVAALMVR
jgi:uncharacterized protein